MWSGLAFLHRLAAPAEEESLSFRASGVEYCAAEPGAIAAAQHAGAVLIAAGARPSSAWWLESWDRFCIPKPFASVEVVYSAPLHVGEGKEELRRGIQTAQRVLHDVTYPT